jgi:NADPH2:quinone reductase
MARMRAMAIEAFAGPAALRKMDLPRPTPAPGEVLVRVVSAGVNPIEGMIVDGELQGVVPHAFPLVPGLDAAGVVDDFGTGVNRFRKGDKVWLCAKKDLLQWGTWCEYVAAPESCCARMPVKLLFEEAAAMPTAALTAWQCLHAGDGISGGNIVLVHAAAGGVGHFAVQLAVHAGATVLGTCGPRNLDFVFGLGATAIDYTREPLADALAREAPDGVDLVIDTVGGETLTASYDLVRAGGRVLSIVEEPDAAAAKARGIRAAPVLVEPDGKQLEALAALVDAGAVKPHVQKIYPLTKAGAALALLRERHVRGKLVLNL